MKRLYTYIPFHCNTVLTVFRGNAPGLRNVVVELAFPKALSFVYW